MCLTNGLRPGKVGRYRYRDRLAAFLRPLRQLLQPPNRLPDRRRFLQRHPHHPTLRRPPPPIAAGISDQCPTSAKSVASAASMTSVVVVDSLLHLVGCCGRVGWQGQRTIFSADHCGASSPLLSSSPNSAPPSSSSSTPSSVPATARGQCLAFRNLSGGGSGWPSRSAIPPCTTHASIRNSHRATSQQRQWQRQVDKTTGVETKWRLLKRDDEGSLKGSQRELER